MLFSLGVFIGSILEKKLKTILIGSFFVWFFATLMDPLLKPFLDSSIKVNTVGSILASLIVNSILLALFWSGFIMGKKYH